MVYSSSNLVFYTQSTIAVISGRNRVDKMIQYSHCHFKLTLYS